MKYSYLLTAACCLLASPALAQVDQINPYVAPAAGNASVSVAVDQQAPFYQSFTPTLAGINYATFLFYSFASTTTAGGVSTNGPSVPANFTVRLYSGDGSFSSSNLLGATAPTVVPANTYGNIQFDFANTIALTPGQKYSLLISDLTYVPGAFYDDDSVVTTQNNAYAGGRAGLGPDADLVFSEGLRATATGAVPEPATWAMTILGMGAIGFAMRRRKVTTRVSYAA